MSKEKILVLGDSFGTINSTSYHDQPESWLSYLTNKYNWDVTNHCLGGSGPIYLIDHFLDLIEKNKFDFDLCILLWSEPFRMFRPGDPRFRDESGDKINWLRGNAKHRIRREQINAKNKYSKWLHPYSQKYYNLIHCAQCAWFDLYIRQKCKRVKFWHMHSYPYYQVNKQHFAYAGKLENQIHYHYFGHGINITPSLIYFSMNDEYTENSTAKEMENIMQEDKRTGHLTESMHITIGHKLSALYELPYKNQSQFSLVDDDSPIKLSPYAVDTRIKI